MMRGYRLDTAVGCSDFNSGMQLQQTFYEDGSIGTNIPNNTKHDMLYKEYGIINENTNKFFEKEKDMSFVGLLRTRNGMIAFADTKSTVVMSNGEKREEENRETKKMFRYDDGILLSHGINLLHHYKDHKSVYMEEVLSEFFDLYEGDHFNSLGRDLHDFIKRKQLLIPEHGGCFFINVMKKNDSYAIECFQIDNTKIQWSTFCYPEVGRMYFGGAQCYQALFQNIDGKRILRDNDNIKNIEKRLVYCLQDAVKFYDEWLFYNPVGGNIETEII
ncbi:MAG: hypothetical protein ACLSX0_01060 [Anaerostipes caccae]|jgi:hypothetical protein